MSSESNKNETTTVAAELEIQPSVEFSIGVRPYRVFCRRKGNFKVVLINKGITDVFPSLEATDLDAGLRFQFKNDRPGLLAWKTIEVPLVARPKRGYLKGEKKRYDIHIQSATVDGNTQTTNAELNQSPLITSWKPVPRAISALIVLTAVVLIGYILFHMGGGFDTFASGPQAWFFRVIRTFNGWFLN